MDHSENDKRFCVYVLKDTDGNVCYVGSGNELRANKKQRSNNKELLSVIRDLTVEVIKANLSKDDSILEEIILYERYKNNGHLLNKQKPSGIRAISYALIDTYLYYDETSPTFLRWKVDVPSGRYNKVIKIKAGDVAGTIKKSGYAETKLQGDLYKNHRIIWTLFLKEDLKTNLVVDHIDRNKTNNKIENLRLVTQKQNMNNTVPDEARELDGMVGILVKLDAPMIYATWPFGFTRKCKTFNYRKLFPNIEEGVAQSKCIELAVWYRAQMIAASINTI